MDREKMLEEARAKLQESLGNMEKMRDQANMFKGYIACLKDLETLENQEDGGQEDNPTDSPGESQ